MPDLSPERYAWIQRNGLVGEVFFFCCLLANSDKAFSWPFCSECSRFLQCFLNFTLHLQKLDAGLAEADSAEGPARAIVQSNSYGWVAMLYDMCLTCERLPLQEAVFASRRFCVILDFPWERKTRRKR